MDFKIEEMQGNADVKRVVVVPSNEEGGFVFNHPYYGQRVVGKLGVKAFRDDTQEIIEFGMATVGDYFKSLEDSSDYHAVPGLDVVAVLDIPGSGNTVTVEVELFKEVAPVK